ncbi:MAG TPA: DegT/DnrJ/EryC1/StrS family aminotransferase, partial [Anaerolineae bacterium]|nr:DegT/DnrJ/EryC1/StrS family aminotransferase [Anaerolineae bacterium]
GDAEKQAVLDVLDSGMLVQGPRTAQLEEKFVALTGAKHAIAIVNGTAALHLALLAHGIGKGDEVITSPFTFIASVNAILYCGARPVFVDIDPDSFNLNPALLEQVITPHTKAIMPVHLFGNPCELAAINEIAARHGVTVIEDAAQAVGATYRNEPIGKTNTTCFSLYATKNITCGEGGIITTNDAEIARRCRLLRNHGMERRYYHDILGYNFRLSDLHAAIGLAQMERLDWVTQSRRANALYFNGALKTVITPKLQPEREHVFHQYTIRLDGMRLREAAVKQLNAAGIGTGIFYPVPAHCQRHIEALGLGAVRLPVAEQLANEVISIPVHPLLTSEDLEKIAFEVNRL